jgi:hypothetical protein
MDRIRRQMNRQIMAEYKEKSKVSLLLAKTGETVLVERGLRKYYSPMEGKNSESV